MEIKSYFYILAFFSLLCGSEAFAATSVYGYGATVDEAQEAAMDAALQLASKRGTCIGAIDECVKQDDGSFRCRAWVADHRGSCR